MKRGAVFSGWRFPKITSTTIVAPVLLLLLVMPCRAEAQSAGKVALVGVLYPGGRPLGPLETFREGLRERGYVEGRNLKLEWRFAEGHDERLPRLARELVNLKVDAIFAINTQAAQAAKSTSQTIPIVVARVADPVRTGLVASLARPGGNVTGLTSITDELAGKRVQLLREALPKAQRVAVVWNSGNPGLAITLRETEAASLQFGLKVQALPVQSANDLPKVFEAITKGHADVVVVLDDVLITSHKQQIMEWATKSHLPVVSIYREFAEAGALFAYEPSIRDMYRRAAYFVDKILKGTKPGNLPVEQPTQFELVINLTAVKTLGLTIPQSLVARADEIVQ